MENSNIVKKAIDYIRNEFSKNDITLDDVAANAGFSTNYFNSIFATHTGFNVMEYVRFTRLKNAAILLCRTDRDVLDIALECGYEAHESFSRAFKKQYGMTPKEYRQSKTQNLFFEDLKNETVGFRITHEFPKLKLADKDEVVDHLLEKNSVRYGWIALNFLSMAEQPFYLGNCIDQGIVYFNESRNKMHCRIVSDDYDEISRCVKMLDNDRFSFQIYTADDTDKVANELLARGITGSVKAYLSRKVYTGEPFSLDMPEGISIRALGKDDLCDAHKALERCGIKNEGFDRLFTDSFKTNKETAGKHGRWLFNGIYHNGEIIGFDTDVFLSVRGFSVNNGIQTFLPEEYRRDEMFILSLKYMTNRIIEMGGLPTYVKSPMHSKVKGDFDPDEIGYRNIWNVCTLEKA